MLVDKESIHVIIEILTVILMPLLTYFVRSTMREALTDLRLDYERRLGSIVMDNALMKQSLENMHKRVVQMEEIYSILAHAWRRVNKSAIIDPSES